MSDLEALNQALRGPPPLSRRERRAMMTRARALSPLRILTQVLLVPVVTLAVTVSVYVRTSPYDRQDALRHLAAMTGCDTAQAMGLAPAMKGQLGYHARNDKDGDGVACSEYVMTAGTPALPYPAQPTAASDPSARPIAGAKFLRP